MDSPDTPKADTFRDLGADGYEAGREETVERMAKVPPSEKADKE